MVVAREGYLRREAGAGVGGAAWCRRSRTAARRRRGRSMACPSCSRRRPPRLPGQPAGVHAPTRCAAT